MSALIALIVVASSVCALTAFAVGRIARGRRHTQNSDRQQVSVPVSVLKPLCGADDALEQNLRTFFEQDYEHFELIFGVTDPDDPAVDIVESLAGRYPNVVSKLVVHDGGRAINPKVANLRGMLDAVEHDVVVISDSHS